MVVRVLFFLVLYFSSLKLSAQFYSIPESSISLSNYFNSDFLQTDLKVTVQATQMSKQITLKEYKEYLSTIKKDSSNQYYLTQLPDSAFTSKELFKKYFDGNAYDEFPVVGISWDNAMNYCRWRTIKENGSSELKYYYRLPNIYEWLWASDYLSSIASEVDFNNGLYADWLMDTKDESYLNPDTRSINLSYYYFHEKNDPPVMKRKIVMGSSFLLQFQSPLMYLAISYYADHGYRNIGFRIVKDSSEEGLKTELHYGAMDEELFEYTNPILNKLWNLPWYRK